MRQNCKLHDHRHSIMPGALCMCLEWNLCTTVWSNQLCMYAFCSVNFRSNTEKVPRKLVEIYSQLSERTHVVRLTFWQCSNVHTTFSLSTAKLATLVFCCVLNGCTRKRESKNFGSIVVFASVSLIWPQYTIGNYNIWLIREKIFVEGKRTVHLLYLNWVRNCSS